MYAYIYFLTVLMYVSLRVCVSMYASAGVCLHMSYSAITYSYAYLCRPIIICKKVVKKLSSNLGIWWNFFILCL